MFRLILTTLCSLWLLTAKAEAFCGFYVAQADGDLFNGASKVAIARKGERTVVTMANDYQGDLSEFAIVIPVPTVISREQVHVTTPDGLTALDKFSAPRLAEYYDASPCAPPIVYEYDEEELAFQDRIVVTGSRISRNFGVTVEDSYAAGEYDILILSAEEAGGLQRWLTDNGYKMPRGARRILRSYVRSGMKFFVAKVNLERKAESEDEWLSPVSIAYSDANFMLPIRLGTLNANGSQDLIVFALSSEGRVETTNYQTRKIPTDQDVPLFLKEEEGRFGEFYKAMFDHSVEAAGGSGVFMEYFWDIGSCDPCAGDPPNVQQLAELGVFWMDAMDTGEPAPSFKTFWKDEFEQDITELQDAMKWAFTEPYWGDDLFLTRLHIRYDAKSFPMDLEFQETGDSDDYFQGRYVVNVPWRGEETCDALPDYVAEVAERQEAEFTNLANMTGWTRASIKARAAANGDYPFSPLPKGFANGAEASEAEARIVYDRLFWWTKAFPELLEPDEDDTED